MENELKELVGKNEKILYEGRPDKKCFILESIFNPLLPLAILWAIIDFGLIGATLFGEDASGPVFIIIPFMLFHLMPVWIYFGGILFIRRKHKNTYYIVTDTGVYTSSGIFSKKYNHKPFAELSHVDLHRGIFDQMCGAGDITLTSSHRGAENVSSSITLSSIKDYANTYNLVKKLQKDIYTDVMYPNDKRPSENHGYNTEYKD